MSIHIPTTGDRANENLEHQINFLKFNLILENFLKPELSAFDIERLVNSESLYQRQPSLFTKTPQRPLKKNTRQ